MADQLEQTFYSHVITEHTNEPTPARPRPLLRLKQLQQSLGPSNGPAVETTNQEKTTEATSARQVVKSISDPQRLRDTLNAALNGAAKLRGVNRSRGGKLVLHTQAPFTAVQLREHEQTIWSVIRRTFPYSKETARGSTSTSLGSEW
ncbi:hypothetical protein R3P38DRAFT_3629348 [Favolaschia claudopus]|uniref:Uncharacterized protein n=1 Tax=Favolaschia claudopus TaxID=2862362 RepID=A0AAV9ZYA3_9AGAR